MKAKVVRLAPGAHGYNSVVETPQTFTFPGGEVGLKLNPLNYAFNQPFPSQRIIARLCNSEDVMQLVMLINALDSFPKPIHTELVMPYCPYARQDRVCVPGEPFSLKAFAGLINSLNFDKVTIFDPHSDVVGAVFDRVKLFSQKDIIRKFDKFDEVAHNGTFISPDAGANKKTAELAKYFGHSGFIRADKLRDLNTGKILETIVYADDLKGETCIIADDICDGGRTFIELAKVLKGKGAAKVVLYVTHGIFSAGVDVLFNSGIDEVFTTTSFREEYGDGVAYLNLEEAFGLLS